MAQVMVSALAATSQGNHKSMFSVQSKVYGGLHCVAIVLSESSTECFVYKWRCYGFIDLWISYILPTPSNISFSIVLWPQPSKHAVVCFRRHKTVLGIKTVKLDCHCQATPLTYTDTVFMNFKLPNFPQGAMFQERRCFDYPIHQIKFTIPQCCKNTKYGWLIEHIYE